MRILCRKLKKDEREKESTMGKIGAKENEGQTTNHKKKDGGDNDDDD